MQLLKSSQEPLTNERSADRPSWLPVSLLTVARCRRSRLGLSWKLHLEFAADCGTDDEQLGSNANVPDGIRKATRSDEIRPIIRPWPLPPLRPKRAASGVAGLRYRSGQRKTNHALMSETSAGTSVRGYST